jgi:hypothetical protein
VATINAAPKRLTSTFPWPMPASVCSAGLPGVSTLPASVVMPGMSKSAFSPN